MNSYLWHRCNVQTHSSDQNPRLEKVKYNSKYSCFHMHQNNNDTSHTTDRLPCQFYLYNLWWYDCMSIKKAFNNFRRTLATTLVK